MMERYILIGQTPVLCANLLKWAEWYQTAPRHVGETIAGPYRVSTVCLGIDHNWSDEGPPILFETMVFPDLTVYPEETTWEHIARAEAAAALLDADLLDFQQRYSTWSEAEEGHARVVISTWMRVFQGSPQRLLAGAE
jgi:hypothetical protein